MSDDGMFPRTAEERLAAVRQRLEADIVRREKSIAKAQEKLSDAVYTLAEFDAAVVGLAQQNRPDGGMHEVLQEISRRVNDGELDHEGVTVTAKISLGEAEYVKTAGKGPVVYVDWPGGETHRVEVGEHTRFSNLVAGYLAELPEDHPHKNAELADFAVLDCASENAPRDPKEVVQTEDYGHEFKIWRAES